MPDAFYILVLLSPVLVVAGIFNALVRRRNEKRNAFSQIDVQLQRRYELIPNLVTSAERFLKHEKQTLVELVEARNVAKDASREAGKNPEAAGAISRLSQAEQMLGNAMGRFNVVVEDYPELKGDQTIQDLMTELRHTENRIGYARQAYSDMAMLYNNAVETFPSNLVAGWFNFKPAELFQIEAPEMRKAVKVDFAA